MPPAPFRLELPALPEGEPNDLTADAAQTLTQRLRTESPERRALGCTFIRLVEHAVREYRLAAAESAQDATEPQRDVIHYLRAASCLESCMNSMQRAAQLVRALEGAGLAAPARRSHGVRSELALVALAGMRTAMQNLDKRILAHQTGTGQIAPATRDGDLCIANASVRMELLVTWLRELEETAAGLLSSPPEPAR